MPKRQPMCRAADDFKIIRENLRRIEAERRQAANPRATAASVPAARTGKADPNGVDVCCTQPCAEDYGVIASADHIAIRRSPTARQP